MTYLIGVDLESFRYSLKAACQHDQSSWGPLGKGKITYAKTTF